MVRGEAAGGGSGGNRLLRQAGLHGFSRPPLGCMRLSIQRTGVGTARVEIVG